MLVIRVAWPWPSRHPRPGSPCRSLHRPPSPTPRPWHWKMITKRRLSPASPLKSPNSHHAHLQPPVSQINSTCQLIVTTTYGAASCLLHSCVLSMYHAPASVTSMVWWLPGLGIAPKLHTIPSLGSMRCPSPPWMLLSWHSIHSAWLCQQPLCPFRLWLLP